MQKVLLLEFNEICPQLIDKWMDEGKLPNFAAFHRLSQVFTTIADVSDPELLEPWIQWYSIHTGLPYHEHEVFYLTDGPKAGHQDIWRCLHAIGKSVMNCSSMNARSLAGDRVFYLPDPWCTNEPAFPDEIEPFKSVMAKLVQENTKGIDLTPSELFPFLIFLLRHGLAPDTVWAILKQLNSEQFSRWDVKWRRVALADRLQFDVFRHYYRRMRPDFATFFINSTAHLQHSYWRHMDPEAFSLKPSSREAATYRDAVLFGYRAMDALLGRFCTLIDDETTMILCSALSQQPFLKREDRGGQRFYRLRDISQFRRLIGIEPRLVEPTMTHQYLFRFDDPAQAEHAVAAISHIRLGNEQVLAASVSGDAVYIGCQLFDEVDKGSQLTGISGRNDPVSFFDLFYPIDAVKSGCHHPEGVLWVRTGHHAVYHERVSILDITPTVYDLLGVRRLIKGEMIRGESLTATFRSGSGAVGRAA
jgi:hypothetical protein